MQSPDTDSLRGRRRAVIIVFSLLIAVDLAAVGSSWLQIGLLDRLGAGAVVTDAELDASDGRQAVFGLLQLWMLLVALVVFIRWLRAAYRGVDRLAPGVRRYGHGWAIGAWFVPFLNLWRPKQIVNDVWRAGGTRGASEPLPWWLNVWWAGWLAAGALSQFAGRGSLDTETIDELRTSDMLFIASDLFDAIVAAVAIYVVLRLSERLDGKSPPAPVPGPSGSIPPPWHPPAPERVLPSG
jgi:uncharacterized protein DUF4328